MTIQETHDKFLEILGRVRYNDWEKILKIDGDRLYFQWGWAAKDNNTGQEGYEARSRKWYLSPFMTETEIVNTAFVAAKIAEEHEIREQFQYKPFEDDEWRTPYNTHIAIDLLWQISTEADLDMREVKTKP